MSAARDGVQLDSTRKLREAQALAGQLVGARRRVAAQFAAAVRAHIAVADVVGENEDDVGFLAQSGTACVLRH